MSKEPLQKPPPLDMNRSIAICARGLQSPRIRLPSLQFGGELIGLGTVLRVATQK